MYPSLNEFRGHVPPLTLLATSLMRLAEEGDATIRHAEGATVCSS